MTFTHLAEAARRHNARLDEEGMKFLDELESEYIASAAVAAKKAVLELVEKKNAKKPAEKPFVHGSNGLIQYHSGTGGNGEESIHERRSRERFWKSLGKKIRKGSRIA